MDSLAMSIIVDPKLKKRKNEAQEWGSNSEWCMCNAVGRALKNP